MSERLKFQGRLLEKAQAAKTLENKIKGLIGAIRDRLDPFEEIEGLETDVAAEMAVELAARKIEYVEALAEIKAIKKTLGKA